MPKKWKLKRDAKAAAEKAAVGAMSTENTPIVPNQPAAPPVPAPKPIPDTPLATATAPKQAASAWPWPKKDEKP